MSSVQDVISLLSLDPLKSLSPFGGQHRTILLSKDFSNMTDFMFHSLLQNFARKEPQTPQLLITLSHDWSNYSSTAAKCGFNLRRKQNGGNMEVCNVMIKYLENLRQGKGDHETVLCDYIVDTVIKFINSNTLEESNTSAAECSSKASTSQVNSRIIKPLVVMIDDLSILLSIGCTTNQVYRLFSLIDKTLRDRSKEIQSNKLSHFIVQTTMTSINKSERDQLLSPIESDYDLNYLMSNLENLSDMCIYLRPLDTGFSSRVDGTIKIVDNRLSPIKTQPSSSSSSATPTPTKSSRLQNLERVSLFQPKDGEVQIGIKKAFFYKLGDRRARLTSEALIF